MDWGHGAGIGDERGGNHALSRSIELLFFPRFSRNPEGKDGTARSLTAVEILKPTDSNVSLINSSFRVYCNIPTPIPS